MVRENNVEADLAALKEATRAAHEAIKDLKHVIKEAEQIKNDLAVTITAEGVDQMISTAVEIGLDTYKAELQKAIDSATDAVIARFDTLSETLLGTSRRQVRRGESIPQLIERHRRNTDG